MLIVRRFFMGQTMTGYIRQALFALLAGGLTMGMWAHADALAISDGRSAATLDELKIELQSAPPGVRSGMSKQQMALFVKNYLEDGRLLAAAQAAGTADLAEVKAQIEKAKRDILVRAYVKTEIARIEAALPNLESLARDDYEVNKAAYKQPEAIRVAHILFKTPADGDEKSTDQVKAKAEKILSEIRAGGDFTALAKENSEDIGSASNGGELPGWQEKGRLVAPFEQAAYAMKPGEVSGLVKSQFGFHIIKLLAHRETAVAPFDEVKAQAIAKVRSDLMQIRRKDFMKQFAGTKPVEIDDATLEALRKD
ncbi:MAG: hypothetical protein COW07_02430 [Hydrogenophilales bacterium CG12_big_fil_rev_8_21_14_0_65_61_21]|nr:MAG: hypothetical protein COW07_02430 [Hydrogenophilales bacterium CG12_big_fil_rev_8_21_14_0_65_61_21]